LHFTQPEPTVIADQINPGKVFDLETLEEEDLDYSLKVKVAQMSKISISYDI
jgi:hypothetical protein|tara:strand:+ start:378 stop:533 length:156 start_codon:yes stop_codon:yes gene_type:complete